MTLSGVLIQFNVFPGSKRTFRHVETPKSIPAEKGLYKDSMGRLLPQEAQSAADPFILDFQ